MNNNNNIKTDNNNQQQNQHKSSQSFLSDDNITLQDISNTEERSKRILDLSDRMLEKISRAIDEIDICIIKDKKRVKEVEYDDELKKPIKEIYSETETVGTEKTTVDTGALKQLVSTLKDIRDIQLGICSASENNDETEKGVIVISDVVNQKESGL